MICIMKVCLLLPREFLVNMLICVSLKVKDISMMAATNRLERLHLSMCLSLRRRARERGYRRKQRLLSSDLLLQMGVGDKGL